MDVGVICEHSPTPSALFQPVSTISARKRGHREGVGWKGGYLRKMRTLPNPSGVFQHASNVSAWGWRIGRTLGRGREGRKLM